MFPALTLGRLDFNVMFSSPPVQCAASEYPTAKYPWHAQPQNIPQSDPHALFQCRTMQYPTVPSRRGRFLLDHNIPAAPNGRISLHARAQIIPASLQCPTAVHPYNAQANYTCSVLAQSIPEYPRSAPQLALPAPVSLPH